LAHENAWGYNRILGELKKLGIFVSRTTVKNILIRHGCEPCPDRRSDSWENFLKRHASTLWACDFISKKIWTKSGFVDCFMLFYIHLSTRRVHLGGVSVDPNASWLMRQARNAAMVFEDQPDKPADKPIILIHDRDGKFTPRFDEILESSGVEIKKLPPYAPNLKDYASHCTSLASSGVRFSAAFGRSESLQPWLLTGASAPGGSYRYSDLSV
jgi:putative transposase